MKKLNLKKAIWGTCSNCSNMEGGACWDCADDNEQLIGGVVECSPKGSCVNWTKITWKHKLFRFWYEIKTVLGFGKK